MKTKFFLLVLLSVCFGNAVFSQILWSNVITDTDPSTANPYTNNDAPATGVTVSGIGRGSGIVANSAANRYNANAWSTSGIDLTDYFTFTLTPNATYSLNFTSLAYTGKTSGTGPVNFSLRSSLDGFATDITTYTYLANTTNSVSIDLSAAAFQNLSSAITFRLYGWNAGGAAGTFSVNDFQFNGTAISSTPTSLATDYFRSAATGNWTNPSTWESSHDNSTYFTATLVPDGSASAITVRSGHIVTVNASAASKFLTIDAGGTLNHPDGITLTITNGAPGYDFIVNGTYVINGTQPSISGATQAQINGLVRADANTSGESDDFARNSKVVFSTDAVLQWNTSSFFETASAGPTLTYFQSSGSMVPIFRVTANVSGIGANNTTLFDSKFEVASGYTIKFQNGGAKVFRNGLGGDGTIIHQSIYSGASANCGAFWIGDGTNTTAVIDGTIKIIVEGNVTSTNVSPASSDFQILDKATTTISGSPTITLGQSLVYLGLPVIAGAVFEVSGTLINSNTTNPIDLTYGRLTVSGKGVLSSSSTGTFKCSGTFTKIVSAGTSANTSAGVLKLTSSFNTVYSFAMGISASASVSTSHRIVLGTDVIVANDINFYQGILVTDYKMLTWNNSGGSITLPTTYTNSFIATCDQNGSALVATGLSATTTSPFTGNVGFRINNVKGTSYIMFPVGPNFSRPNKIAINPNNNTTATSITVVVGNGDILYTPQPRVNRIWYVHNSDPGSDTAIGMQLYFTKYDWNVSGFGVGQDEIENGFNRFATYVGRRDYTTDPHLTHRSTPPKDIGALGTSEVFAEYLAASTVHLPGFYKFSVGNFATIILPVSILNVKAYKSGNNVNVEWSALHELNIDHYEVEHSSNGIAFSAISNMSANNNGSQQNNYTLTDAHPLNGNNFYRIKAIDKDGQVKYSSIVSVNMNSNYVGIKVLPNPVNNRLMNIQLSNLPAGKYDLLLYSANGQRVFTTNFTFNGGFSSQVVVLPPNIRTGAYILKLFNGTNKFTQNIMVE